VEGEVDVTVLTDEGPVVTALGSGSACIVPRGAWHRQQPRPTVALLFATAVEGSEISWAGDPRPPTASSPHPHGRE
jgi:hypothetical protein